MRICRAPSGRLAALLAILLIVLPLLVDARPQRPVTPPRAQGRLVLRPICFVDPPQRASVTARRASLEAHEFKVAADGSWIVYPAMPAAGYRVTCGSQTAFVQADGSFPILGSGGVFSHPTDASWRAPFKVGRASTFVWPVGFSMKGSPMGAGGCCPSVAQQGGSSIGARRVAAGGKFHGAAVPVAVRMGPRGSYPEPETPLGCLDDDGGFNSGEPVIDYLGSTCDAYVRAGVCVNEWPATDREYNALRTVAQAAGLLDEGEFLSPTVVPQRKNACADNHKGRACQQLQIGDISVDTGTVTRAGGSTTVTVEQGRPVKLTVHNNGSTGQTEILKTRNDLRGSLDCAKPLLHYDTIGDSSYKYRPDREIGYQAAEDREGTDTYVFMTDGRGVEVRFVAKPTPTPTPEHAAQDGRVTMGVHAVARGRVTSHSKHFTLNDEATFDMNEVVEYRIRSVDSDWVELEEISNHCTYKVTGGGAFSNTSQSKSWIYAVSSTTGKKGMSSLTLKIGSGHIQPALSWLNSSYVVSGDDVHAGYAPGILRDTWREWAAAGGLLRFTFNPARASVGRGKIEHEKSEEAIIGLNLQGTLQIEYSVSIGRLRKGGR